MTESKRASHHSYGSDLSRVAKHVIQPGEYDELPELPTMKYQWGEIRASNAAITPKLPRTVDFQAVLMLDVDCSEFP